MATVRLTDANTATVDELRGDVPRDRFVNRTVEQALGSKERSGPSGGSASRAAPAPARSSSPKDPSGRSPLAARQAALNKSKEK